MMIFDRTDVNLLLHSAGRTVDLARDFAADLRRSEHPEVFEPLRRTWLGRLGFERRNLERLLAATQAHYPADAWKATASDA